MHKGLLQAARAIKELHLQEYGNEICFTENGDMAQAKEMLIKQVAMRARFTRDLEHFAIYNKNSDRMA